jgi:hypothetical protein
MTQELEQLMTARHEAFVEWDKNHAAGTGPKFLEANRAYVRALAKNRAADNTAAR